MIQKGMPRPANSATTVKYFAFPLSDLKTCIDAPRREVTLHTVLRTNAKCRTPKAKGLDRLYIHSLDFKVLGPTRTIGQVVWKCQTIYPTVLMHI